MPKYNSESQEIKQTQNEREYSHDQKKLQFSVDEIREKLYTNKRTDLELNYKTAKELALALGRCCSRRTEN